MNTQDNEPKAGERWYIRFGEDDPDCRPMKIYAVLKNDYFLVPGDYGARIIKRSLLVERLPPRFPRLHRLLVAIRNIWNTPLRW